MKLSSNPALRAAETRFLTTPGTESFQPTGVSDLYAVSASAPLQSVLTKVYASEPFVQYVEPNYGIHVDLAPNDPVYTGGNLYGLNGTYGIQAPSAWDATTGSTSVAIADIDTGIDYDHPDLYENIWINQAEIPALRMANLHHFDANGNVIAGPVTFYDLNYFNTVTQTYPDQGPGKITDVNGDGRIDAADILAPMTVDANGNDLGGGGWVNPQKPNTQDGDTAHPDDLIGWNFVNNTNNPFDDHGHGTHTAGTIGAIGNNATGVVGVNWQTQIMPLKFIDATGNGTDAAAAAAIEYSILHGARISNNSWGGGDNSQTIFNAIQDANNAGDVFVAAAGNNGSNNDVAPEYPASFNLPNIIAVAATDSSGNLASFSDYGPNSVAVAAPGVNIYSTLPNSSYGYLSGTSMATPHVTGTVGLILSEHPTWTVSQIVNQIHNSTTADSALAGKVATGGIINAYKAVQSQGGDLNWTGGGLGAIASQNAGAPFTVTRTYTISGQNAPSNFVIGYYESTSPDPNQNLAGATFVGQEIISAAADKTVGTHTGTSPTLSFPNSGTEYLLAKLDATNLIQETDETNNVAVSSAVSVSPVAVIVANGQAGFSVTGTWGTESQPGDYGGTDRYASVTGTGANSATWQVAGLAAGQYVVQATWPAFYNQPTNAPFAIYDGSSLLQTIPVNESVKPVGGVYGGATFQTIATVNIASGTLKVVLSDSGANGSYIVANAIRVVPVPPTSTDLNWTGSGAGITGPATASTQATFTFSRTFTVSGAAAPTSFSIAYYASTSPSLTQDLSQAIQLGSETISSASDLAVGTHTGTSPAFQIMTAGSYYLFARLNANNAFAETNGSNDLAVTSAATIVSGPTVTNPVIVANGQAGFSLTGTWGTESQPNDYGGTDRYARVGGTGANTATWQVTGLPSGQYTVQVTWPPFSNQATNAPFAIYDGSTLIQTVPVDETKAPVGTVYGGATFQTIATVNLSSGTLKVVLSDNGANGSYIIANAMRVAPVAPTNVDLNWTGSGAGITGPGTASTQATFTISRTYTISGAAAPGSFVIAYYASTSPSLTQDFSQAIQLGTETISAASDLAVGNHAGTSPAFQISTAGTYYLFAKLNANNDFPESSSANNLTVTSTTTVVSGTTVTSPVIVANGQAGYSETGTWASESEAGDYGGTDRYARIGGTGTNTATWQVIGLPSGQYTVQVTWPAFSNQANNAPFAIYDGSTLLKTVAVDETKAPVGSVYGGATFQTIATVNVSSGTLKVVLSDSGASNYYIIANAMRVAPAAPTNVDLNWTGTGAGISGPTTDTTQATFTISRTYTISGAAAPASFAIAYYASPSSSLTQDFSQAILLGTETISAASDLAVGNHAGTSPAFQITTAGTYYLFAKLNANSDFPESDVTNNLTVTSTGMVVSGATVSNPVILANGQAGYSETGTWTTEKNSSDYGGTDRYARIGGTGTNTATWQVTGMPSGQYTVQVTWPAFSNQANNAPFAIYDGSTLLKTVAVDETKAPVGSVYGGATFQTIATVNVSSGTLKVVLSDSGASNYYIIANAMRVAPAAPTNVDLNWTGTGAGISGPATDTTQATFMISRTYTISGAAAPGSFVIAYYASTSSSLTQDFSQSISLGTETVSAASDLAVGNHAGTSPALQINTAGTYYLFAKLNANNDFPESSISNNLAVTSAATVVSGPTVSNPVIVANGQPGFSLTGTWGTESEPGDYGGTDRYARVGGTGANTATWQVTGLAAGQYTVQVTWPAFSNQATNAPFAIYDGSTLLTTVPVDETKAPVGSVYGGATFQTIATVNITSGTLTVVVSDNGANGTWIIANAMRVAPA